MTRTDYFGDREFETLLAVIHPFDTTFPEIQIHIDRLLYELANSFSNGGADESFDEFRVTSIGSRHRRGVATVHPKPVVIQFFEPLVRLLTLVALQYPAIDEHCDRLVYEVCELMNEGKEPETFAEFHREQQLIRSVVHSKVRGQG